VGALRGQDQELGRPAAPALGRAVVPDPDQPSAVAPGPSAVPELELAGRKAMSRPPANLRAGEVAPMTLPPRPAVRLHTLLTALLAVRSRADGQNQVGVQSQIGVPTATARRGSARYPCRAQTASSAMVTGARPIRMSETGASRTSMSESGARRISMSETGARRIDVIAISMNPTGMTEISVAGISVAGIPVTRNSATVASAIGPDLGRQQILPLRASDPHRVR
jgi:hypothetical protein